MKVRVTARYTRKAEDPLSEDEEDAPARPGRQALGSVRHTKKGKVSHDRAAGPSRGGLGRPRGQQQGGSKSNRGKLQVFSDADSAAAAASEQNQLSILCLINYFGLVLSRWGLLTSGLIFLLAWYYQGGVCTGLETRVQVPAIPPCTHTPSHSLFPSRSSQGRARTVPGQRGRATETAVNNQNPRGCKPLNPVWTSVAAGSATHCPFPPGSR